MNVLVAFIDAITFFILTLCLWKIIRLLTRSNKTVYFVLITFYIFFILPIGIDVFITYPNYDTWYVFRNFEKSYNDPYTRIIYDLWILISFVIIYYVGIGKSKVEKYNESKLNNNLIISICFFIGILPVVTVLIFSFPKQIIYTPFWLDKELYNFNGTTLGTIYHALQRLTFISIPTSFLYVVNAPKKNKLRKLFMIINIYFLICIESKRAIIAVLLIMIIAHAIYNVQFNKRKYIFIGGSISVVILIVFSLMYMEQHRVYNIAYDAVNSYTQIKMDFMRDDRVKFAIYSLLNPDKIQILDYPFQSYFTQLTSLFPLEYIIPVEMIGYNKFFTCALLELPLSSGANWVTTSFFDEFIANFGIVGFILGPVIIGKIAIITDRYSNKIKVISIIGIILLFMLSLGYIAWYIQFWIAIFILEKFNLKIKLKN